MATADLTLKETPTAEQESVIRTLATMIAAQNLVVDFTRWQKSPEGTTPEGVTKLLNGLGAFIESINRTYTKGSQLFHADMLNLAKLIGADLNLTYENQAKEVIH